eukprot:TRINITY_DN29288_c0_g1_i1.p1 TRINITY_DN29288_c0_g1~~TRINITY_DN29288_c0_g1_i1.p1  ORF type:complete len:513 (-),score=84.79 TRINITY_DN29288_c0_g1_i1:135-1580(-)
MTVKSTGRSRSGAFQNWSQPNEKDVSAKEILSEHTGFADEINLRRRAVSSVTSSSGSSARSSARSIKLKHAARTKFESDSSSSESTRQSTPPNSPWSNCEKDVTAADESSSATSSSRGSAQSSASSTQLERKTTKIESDSSESESESTHSSTGSSSRWPRRNTFSFTVVTKLASAAAGDPAATLRRKQDEVGAVQDTKGRQVNPSHVPAGDDSLCCLLQDALTQLSLLSDVTKHGRGRELCDKLEQTIASAMQAAGELECRLINAEKAILKGRDDARKGWHELRELAESIEIREAEAASARLELSAEIALHEAERAKSAKAQNELAQLHCDLARTNSELEEARTRAESVGAELDQAFKRLDHTNEDFELTRAELFLTRSKFEKTQELASASHALSDWLLAKRCGIHQSQELMIAIFEAFRAAVIQTRGERQRKYKTVKVASALNAFNLRRRLRAVRGGVSDPHTVMLDAAQAPRHDAVELG